MENITMRKSTLPGLAFTLLMAAPLAAQQHEHPATTASTSTDSQKAFAILKSLAGSWAGTVITPNPKNNGPAEMKMSVTSRGNAVVHDMHAATVLDDPAKYDHPITMLYMEHGKLLLTHYCDAGNRPRMVGSLSADGKTLDFDFVDIVGPTDYGHMQHARFTIIDENHHTEDWTYMVPSKKLMTGHFDLMRAPKVAAAAAR